MAVKLIDVFKKIEIEDYLQAAVDAAAWIKKYEVVDEKGKRWKINGTEGKELDAVESAFLTDTSLYGGASGVGYFFLQLYEVTGNEEYLNEAKDAAKYLISTYQKEEVVNPGIHNGLSGQGIFALYLYDKTGDERYADFARQLAEDSYSQSIKDENGIHWNGWYDFMGDGGVIAYWIYISEKFDDKHYLNYAKEALDAILSLKKEGDDNTIYFELFDPSEYFTGIPKGGVVPNFAHGTAGVVYLLTKYYEATKDEKYLTYAKQGFHFLKSIANNTENASIIPYLYFKGEEDKYDVSYLGFCHGPVGDGIAVRELYKATKDDKYLDFYKRLTEALIEAGVPHKRSSGYWNNCICCGSSGVLLHFIEAAKLTGNQEYQSIANQLAHKLLNDAYKDADGKRWYDAWTRVKPWDVDAHIGLYVGTAGNASTLLTYYANKTQKEITPIFEY